MILFIIAFGLSIILSILFFVVHKITLKNKLKHVRENYVFKSISLLICLSATTVTALTTNYTFWDVFVLFYKLDKPDVAAELISKILTVIIFIITCIVVLVIILKTYSTWSGAISRRQFKINKYNFADSNILKDFSVYLLSIFKRNVELAKCINSDFSDEISSNDITEEIPWHIEFAEIYSIISNQVKINKNTDWHANYHCFIADYGLENHKVAILCYLKRPTDLQIQSFIEYIYKLHNKYFYIIIAIKENDLQENNYIYKYNENEIHLLFKNNCLESLVDFSEYFNAIDILYRRPLIQNSNICIEDVYVEPNCRISNNENEFKLSTYILDWLDDCSTRQIALLGDFGQGKTVYSVKLTHDLIENNSSRVPILISLRGKSPRNSNPIEILSYFASQYEISAKALDLLNRNGKLILIFDGFDEMDLVGNDDIRKMHFKHLWELVSKQSKILITGRPNYFIDTKEMESALGIASGSKEIPYCEALYLLPFNENQIYDSLRNVNMSIRDGIQEIMTLKSSKSFIDLLSRPSHLFLISQIWNERKLGERYNNLTSAIILNEFLKSCFERQIAKANSKDFYCLSSIEREYFMIGIAVKMYKMGISYIGKDLFYNTVGELIDMFPDELSLKNPVFLNFRNGKTVRQFATENEDPNLFEAIVNDVRICGILINDTANDGLTFAHKSFFELLIAKYFVVKVLKIYDSNMLISNTLMQSSIYKIKLQKNDFLIRKLLAELISEKISVTLTKYSENEKCLLIFNQCYKSVVSKIRKSTPQKAFKEYIKLNNINDLKEVYKPNGSKVSKSQFKRLVITMIVIFLSLLVFIFKSIKIMISYGEPAKEYFNSNAYKIMSSSNNIIHFPFWLFYILGTFVTLLILYNLMKEITKQTKIFKLEVALLTWFYACQDNQISDQVILSQFSKKTSRLFSKYIEQQGFIDVTEKIKMRQDLRKSVSILHKK